MVLLDIPGLIEGASTGKGLGLAFLRHAERCRVLLHLVDGEETRPGHQLRLINSELSDYSASLAAMPQAVLLTKTDLPHVRGALPAKLKELREAAGHSRILAVSSADGTNLRDLLVRTHRLLGRMERAELATTNDEKSMPSG
jgi:GTP-binding protein